MLKLNSYLEWIDRHWSPKRGLASLILASIGMVLLTCVYVGAVQAYGAESAADLIPASMWAEIMSDANDMSSPIVQAIFIIFSALMLAFIDATSRLVYAYLLWVPMQFWTLVSWVALYGPAAVILFNLLAAVLPLVPGVLKGGHDA